MINLELKSTDFKGNEKWVLLYVIADIYSNVSNKEKPLNDMEVVSFAKEKYGLDIERRTINKYRNYLSKYFGFIFATRNKGHYLINKWKLVEDQIKKNQLFLKQFTNYDVERIDCSIGKIAKIDKAIKSKLFIEIWIDHYIHIFRRRNKNGEIIAIRKKKFKIAPLKIFKKNNDYYLFAYYPNEDEYYLFLIKNIKIKPNCIVKEHWQKTIDIDIDNYIRKQDFLLTGPIDQYSKDYHYNEPYEWVPDARDITLYFVCKYFAKRKFSHPFIFQSLIDLYGENMVETYSPRLDDCFGVSFPYDQKTGVIVSIIDNNDDIDIIDYFY